MCLIKRVPIKTNGIGYKWVVKWQGGYYAPNVFPNKKIPYSLVETNVAINVRDSWVLYENVEWGFHIFNNLHEAKISKWGKLSHEYDSTSILLKVKYSEIRFTGIGTGLWMLHDYTQIEPYEIIVAEKMTIIGEVE